ncbi:hypothetical protein NC651_007301 [Populus alba x Populus x berolinensis]|nr:hypothetical protein NC651_007301 [Populus alba x Populus x berolinensis]
MSDWSIESPDFACKKEARRQAKPHLNVPFSFCDESGLGHVTLYGNWKKQKQRN